MRPHKTRYWLNPKISDWNKFAARVELICNLILRCISGQFENEHLFSVDEKSGIQALEREQISGVKPGQSRRIEYEYVRHGTTCLMGAVDVSNGKMPCYRIHPTRKEDDFVIFIDQLISMLPPEDKVIILLDQLNIHKSASLVRFVADQIGFTEDLGTKEYKGILKSQQTRMAFLEQEDHRIRFVFTPKHCSWLNPIENWFGALQKRRITNSTFMSIEELEEKLIQYIEFTNRFLAKKYKWKFKGFLKGHKLVA